MTVLVVAEHDNAALKMATLNTVTAAGLLSDDVHVLVAGESCAAVAEETAQVEGVAKVWIADAREHAHHLAENLAPLIVREASAYTHLLAPATTFGKNVMPRAAALLDAHQISDISGIESTDTFVRPIYAGNAFATVRSCDPIKVITIRSTAFEAAAVSSDTADVQAISGTGDTGLARFTGHELTLTDRPELTSADIVVSGGRGMQSRENFQLLEKIADKLGAAIGATRAAVDAGYVSNDYQVGQTGKVVAPDLYIAIGISGAIQHLAGIKGSKVIVAINNDAEAPIFQIADYGLVADLFEVLPKLAGELDKSN
jgi:electron transfer flavoprotein alpha subunit